ncbi:bleomycin resistance family protein [Lysobacteraceae bacterium NML07-0707]|nr:bleomycin resistance family protein [Xanthomonadaceae bacterium NML07-0707]
MNQKTKNLLKIKKLTPVIAVENVQKTAEFYTKYLGFQLAFAVPNHETVEQFFENDKEYRYAMLKSGELEIAFQRLDTFQNDIPFAKNQSIGGSVSFHMDVDNIENLYNRLKSENLEVTELKTTWYGVLEFYLKDLNGYILEFTQSA